MEILSTLGAKLLAPMADIEIIALRDVLLLAHLTQTFMEVPLSTVLEHVHQALMLLIQSTDFVLQTAVPMADSLMTLLEDVLLNAQLNPSFTQIPTQ